MISSRTAQDTVIIAAMLWDGICTGLAYDGLRIFRKLIPHKKVWVDREDLVFWICAGLLYFYGMVREFEGKVRISYITVAIAGLVFYELSVSTWVVKAGAFLLKFPVRLFRRMFFPVLCCIKWLKYQVKRGRITLYGHLARICRRKNDRGERKHNGESRI